MVLLSININRDRVYKIAEVFRDLGINGVKRFEDIDQQYLAIKHALERCSQSTVIRTFYANALIAYKLRVLGEIFWKAFADHVISNCHSNDSNDLEFVIKLVEDFTYRFNNYLAEQKIRRLRRIANCNKLWSLLYTGRYVDLAKETARCLKTSVDAKTIVFSIKILYFVHRAQGLDIILPSELPIPVDRRVAYITYMSKLIDITNSYENKYLTDLLLKNSKTIKKVWSAIASETDIPPLHIDSVLWYFGKYTNIKNINEVLMKIDDTLYELLGEDLIQKLVKELFYRLLSREIK